jgi:Protein of unknown function (DUF4232)
MNTRAPTLVRRWATASFAIAAAVVATASLASAAPRARSAASSPCSASDTQAWLGDGEGGGTAGTTYYPLEFSNIGHRVCTLYGYPGVSAYRGALQQVGTGADHSTSAHLLITLRPNTTGHALLGIRDWGALCSKPVAVDGLKVYPPNQRSPKEIGFSFDACAHQGVLVVGPVRAGAGIPGYTGP